MNICSKEMAAIVFGAGGPGFAGSGGAFGGGSSTISSAPSFSSSSTGSGGPGFGGGASGGGFGGGSSNVSCAGPSASSSGGAAAGTVVGNSINGDGSFQNGVASLMGGLVAWGVEAGTLVATRNPVAAAIFGAVAGTTTANYVGSLEGPGPLTPQSVGPEAPANSHGWNTNGRGEMSGGSETGTSARDGMGFGGTGSGI